jgi:hypothetical protein
MASYEDTVINPSIDNYIATFGTGARQYLFSAILQFPIGLRSNMDVRYFVKSTSLPESTFEEESIAYPGYPFKMANSRTYGDWTVSLYVDKKAEIYNSYHNWQNLIFDPSTYDVAAPNVYMIDQQLELLNGEMQVVSRYNLFRAWPKAVGALTLDYASTDIITFDVTFSYQYFKNDYFGTE